MNDKTDVTPNASASRTWTDWLAEALIKLLQKRKEPDGLVQKTARQLRFGLTCGSVGYLLGLLLLWILLEWHAEQYWLLWGMMYLPQQVWLLPLVPLIPLCLFLRPLLLVVHALTVVVVLVLLMDLEWAPHQPKPARSVTFLSNNIGQKGGHRLTPYVEQKAPDIIALQDAKHRGKLYARQYREWHTAYHDEFVLISRYPIVESRLVDLNWEGSPVCARFELNVEGTVWVVYNVHMPTPRHDLQGLKGRRGIGEILRDIGVLERTDSLPDRIASRLDLARHLADLIEGEGGPTVLIGDLNVPSKGRTYRVFADDMLDAFGECGRGYGYTVPGTTRNPLSLFGPWLRVDHVFSRNGLVPVECEVEPRRKSQHRAVVARLALKAWNE